MNCQRLPLLLICLCSFATVRANDGLQDNLPDNVRRIPAAGVPVPDDRRAAMTAQLQLLQQQLKQLRETPAVDQSLLPDVMIFERAVRCALDYDEFFDVKDFDKADELLAEGLLRARQLQAGKPEWTARTGLIVRGYISRIDQTVQPYGLIVPSTYDLHHSVPTRLDVWFHGRGEKLSEVNFLWERMRNPGEFAPPHTLVLHPYGRYCNAFKFAGEVDVLEAIEDVSRRYRVDEDRVSVRGFSMGGAACWQFATHYSDRWFAAAPGAGFSETPQFLKVFQKEELKPQPWQQKLWNLYDCDKWALNLTHCPTIAYSGENDSQKQAADVMEQALAGHGIRLRHIIGAGMGHKYDAASKQLIEQTMTSLAKSGREQAPPLISLTTWTLRYNRMKAATIDGMLEHWKPATLMVWCRETERPGHPAHLQINTENVSAFTVNFAAGELPLSPETLNRLHHPPNRGLVVELISAEDQQRGPNAHLQLSFLHAEGPFSDGSMRIQGHRNEQGKWVEGPPPAGLRKKHLLQGPIDDAFMDAFVFVRPTGQAANEQAGRWADAELTRAIEHWRRHFRGDARVVKDSEVTDELIQSANLVLWGDPQSNSVLGKIAGQLPVQWTSDTITVGAQKFSAATHAPAMIYPNPLNPNRYVVLNSSFTFRDYAYLNNARQVPMLPDWAVIDLTTPPNSVWPGRIAAAGFFNENWQPWISGQWSVEQPEP
ncbi:MAG: prolyl oligopeptidase family serine peptidase [Planctomyces sp.]